MSAWGGMDDSADSSVNAPELDFDMDAVRALAASDREAAAREFQRALNEAAQNGNEAVVHDILGSNDVAPLVAVDAKDEAGSTPLIYASCFGHEHVVAELLRFGADANLQDMNEWTALMWAVNNNHLSIVKQLLAADADVTIKTGTGRTAFDLQMSSTSATYLYLSAQGYIQSGPGSAGSAAAGSELGADLYEAAVDPSEVEAQFAENLKESALTLGFGASLDDDALPPLSGGDSDGDEPLSVPAPRKPEEELAIEFDWDTFRVRDSLALPRDSLPQFLDLVITDMRPTLQKNQIPTSANALFLAARYFFFCGTEESFTAMVSPISRRIELAVQDPQHRGDLAYLSYWLANTEVFLYYIRREPSMEKATRHDIQPTLEALVTEISGQIQSHAEQLILPLIRPCLLDYESIPEYGKVEYRDEWRLFRAASKHLQRNDDDLVQQRMLPPSQDALIRKPGPQRVTAVLSSLLLLFQIYSVHPVTQLQIVAKLLYFVSSRLFNTIVSSRKYLNRRRAMQIRLNVSVLEDWCRNQNFRPESVEIDGKNYHYKSLIDTGRTFLAPLVQILAWLQTFSGFGSDFTTVVSTLQELKALNPKQLLYTATHYRFETREAPLSKDYKHYLQELASHHSRASEIDTPQSLAPTAHDDNLVSFDDVPGDSPAQTSQLPTRSCVHISYELPVVDDVMVDLELPLVEHVPLLDEAIQYWGGGFGFTQTHSGHFFVPYVPNDLVELLNASGAADEEEVSQDGRNLDVEEPETAGKRPATGEEESISPWRLDRDDELAPVW